MNFEKPSEKVENIDKAREMAKTMNPYETLAINARKAGLAELAKEYEKRSDVSSEKTGETWEEKQKNIEIIIKDLVDKVMLAKHKISEAKKSGVVTYERIPVHNDRDYKNKLDQVLGVEETPFSDANTDQLSGSQYDRATQFKTMLDGVIVRKYFTDNGLLDHYELEIRG